MFDIGLWELVLCGVIALVVLGPERLPAAARSVGLWVGKARRAWFSLRSELEQELQIQDLRQQILKTQQQLQQLQPSLERVESLNDITDAFKSAPAVAAHPEVETWEPGSEPEPVGFSAEALLRQQQNPIQPLLVEPVSLESEPPRAKLETAPSLDKPPAILELTSEPQRLAKPVLAEAELAATPTQINQPIKEARTHVD